MSAAVRAAGVAGAPASPRTSRRGEPRPSCRPASWRFSACSQESPTVRWAVRATLISATWRQS